MLNISLIPLYKNKAITNLTNPPRRCAMPWILIDDNGRVVKRANPSEQEVAKLFKKINNLQKQVDDLSARSNTWTFRALTHQEQVISAIRILEKFDSWWRLPDDKRTIANIESAMADALDFLDLNNPNSNS